MKKGIGRLTQKLDVFGSEIGFSYNASNVFRTQFGASVSVIFFASMIVFFWSSMDRLIQKSQVKFYESQDYNVHPKTLTLNSSNYMFGVQIQQTNFTIQPYYNISLSVCQNLLLPNGTTVKNRTAITLEPCTLNHWTSFSPQPTNISSSFIENGINDFLCPKLNQAFMLEGQFLSQSFRYLKFSISKCKNKTLTADSAWNYTCLSPEQQAKVKVQENLRFRFAMPNYIVNPALPTNILTGFLDMLYFSIQPEAMYSTADIYLTNHKVKTDQSLLPFKDEEEENFVVFTQNNYRSQVLVGNYTAMSEFFIRSDFFSLQTSRSFTKIDEFISYIGGFAQVFLLFSAIIVQAYNQLAYSVKLANKLYDFEMGPPPDKSRKLPKKEAHMLKQSPRGFDENRSMNDSIIKSAQGIGFSEINILPSSCPNEIRQNDDSPRLSKNNSALIRSSQKGTGGNFSKTAITNHFNSNIQHNNSSFNPSIHQQKMSNWATYKKDGQNSSLGDEARVTDRKRQLLGANIYEDSIRQYDDMIESSRSKKDNILDEMSQKSPALLESPQKLDLSQSVKLKQEKRARSQQLINIPSIHKIMSIQQTGIEDQNEDKQPHFNEPNKIEFSPHFNSNFYIHKEKELENERSNLDSPGLSNRGTNMLASIVSRSKNKIKVDTATQLGAHSKVATYDKKEFLETEVKNIIKRTKYISLTIKYFIYKLTCQKIFASEHNILVDKACSRVEDDLDILVLLSRIKEVEKIKDILLDKKQQTLFNFFPKPVIKAKENALEYVPDQRSILKHEQKEEKQGHNKIKKLNISIHLLGTIMKAVKQFKKPLYSKGFAFDNLNDYLKLYEAYEYVTYKAPPSILNDKLVNLLGVELKSVFEQCRKIGARQEKINDMILSRVTSTRVIKQTHEMTTEQPNTNQRNHTNNHLDSNQGNHTINPIDSNLGSIINNPIDSNFNLPSSSNRDAIQNILKYKDDGDSDSEEVKSEFKNNQKDGATLGMNSPSKIKMINTIENQAKSKD